MQKPQVFIQFRGKDERQKLLPLLRSYLEASPSNVKVVTDDDVLGQRLERLFNYIRNSWMVIVVFSVSYLESDWCLDELVEIKRCLQTEKIQFVLPIFYKVKHSEVKEQKGQFGECFLTLKNKFPYKIKKWTKALEYVAGCGGLTYEETRYWLSQLSDLDFVLKVVKKVERILAGSASNEISERKAENSIGFEASDKSQLHFSKTLEALNLEYWKGFMHGSAWKDLITSMQSNNRFEIPLPESSIKFPMNFQSFNSQAQINESIEKAINILALHMMHKPTQPSLIFSNWDNLDHDMKNNIIYSAHKKSKMIKSYKGGVDSEPLFRSNFSPSVEELIRDKTLEPQVWPHRDHRRANSSHDNREQFYPLPYEIVWPVEPLVEPSIKPRVQLPVTPPVEHLVEPLGSNDNTGQRKVVPERQDDNPGYFSSLCYCLKSCVCLT